MNLQMLALAFLAATAIGGLAWVFIYPMLSGEKQAEARRASVAKPEPAARRADNKNQRTRREQVEGSLKELEARRAKESRIALSTRLTQAGLDWSEQKFWMVSGVLGLAAFAAAWAGLLDESDERVRRGLLARQRVVSELDWQPQSRKYVGVWQQVLGLPLTMDDHLDDSFSDFESDIFSTRSAASSTTSHDVSMRSGSPAPSIYSVTSSLRAASYRQEYGRGLNNYSEVYRLPADDEELDRLGTAFVKLLP